MFIGHFGVGFAAKKIDKKPSLGTLFFASQFVDLIWPVLLLTGLEKVAIDPGNTAFTPLNFIYYPFTHSLLGVIIWSVLFGIVYYLIKKNIKISVLMGGLVMSHWILDLITHRPDLPLFPWTDIKVGLGLWNSVILTIIIEVLIFGGGVYLYMKCTKAQNKKGSIGLWGLTAFLLVVYVMNIFGPPPPSSEPIAVVGLAQWLLVLWAYWIDKNRKIS
jgi:membrane-bound metal-dependent hydrolase YbcI (DUF457 family)